MTSTDCASCGASSPDGYLCRTCGRQLREALADLAPGRQLLPAHAEGPAGRGVSTRWDVPSAVVVGGLAGHLDTTVARQSRIGARTKQAKGDLGPPPFNEKGAEVRALLVHTLAPWAAWMLETERPTVDAPACRHRDPIGVNCRRCAVDLVQQHAMRRARWARTAAAVTDGDVGALAAYLLERVNVIEGRDEAGRFHADILRAVRKLEQIVDQPAEMLAAGRCGAELPGGMACRRDLYADTEQPFVTCPKCRTRWPVAERRARLLASAEDALENAATIATALTRLDHPVTADRIYKWKERGRLVQHGTDRRGAPLYRLGDVVDLLAADMQKAEERRVKAAKAEVARARKAS